MNEFLVELEKLAQKHGLNSYMVWGEITGRGEVDAQVHLRGLSPMHFLGLVTHLQKLALDLMEAPTKKPLDPNTN